MERIGLFSYTGSPARPQFGLAVGFEGCQSRRGRDVDGLVGEEVANLDFVGGFGAFLAIYNFTTAKGEVGE